MSPYRTRYGIRKRLYCHSTYFIFIASQEMLTVFIGLLKTGAPHELNLCRISLMYPTRRKYPHIQG